MPFEFVARDICEVCGSDNCVEIFSTPFSNPIIGDFIHEYYSGRISISDLGVNRYTFKRCSDCGFIWQHNILDDRSMEYLYDKAIDTESSLAQRDGATATGFMSLANNAAKIEGFFPRTSSREINVLDYGMGWGHWARTAGALGYQVTGVEISDLHLEFARGMGVTSVTDTEEFEAHSFQVIRAEQVLEHIPDLKRIRDEWMRLLAPNGILMVSVPNGAGSERALQSGNWRPSKGPLHPLEHINTFTHKSLLRFASEVGLTRVTPVLTGSRLSRLEQMPRYILSRVKQRKGTNLFFRKHSE